MITEENKPKSRLSDDLTVILLRGNGSPRTFRLPLRSLQRSLTTMGFLFSSAILAAVFFLLLNLFREPSSTTVVVQAPPRAPEAKPEAKPETKPEGSLWQHLAGSSTAAKSDGELEKEVNGLRADIARLGAAAEGRKELDNGKGLLQFFGPRSVAVPESDSHMQIKNPKFSKSENQINLDFELHNTDPNQQQVRGYILVLGKTKDLLATYPANAFSPTQNIVLDFTKGETFAVSRFRQARATFPAALIGNRRPQYQILLFGTDGRVLANTHVEGQ